MATPRPILEASTHTLGLGGLFFWMQTICVCRDIVQGRFGFIHQITWLILRIIEKNKCVFFSHCLSLVVWVWVYVNDERYDNRHTDFAFVVSQSDYKINPKSDNNSCVSANSYRCTHTYVWYIHWLCICYVLHGVFTVFFFRVNKLDQTTYTVITRTQFSRIRSAKWRVRVDMINILRTVFVQFCWLFNLANSKFVW